MTTPRPPLDELEAKYKAATPGEWERDSHYSNRPEECCQTIIVAGVSQPIFESSNSPLTVVDHDYDLGHHDTGNVPNYEWVCAIHNAFPALAAWVRHQQAVIEAFGEPPIISKYHGHRGFEVERFIADYESWNAGRLRKGNT